MAFVPDNVLESLGEAVLVCDPDERIVWANPACERVLGASPTALQGRSFSELIPSRFRDRTGRKFLQHLLERSTDQILELPFLTDDRARLVELSVRRFRHDGTGWILVSGRPALARSLARPAIEAAPDPLRAAEKLIDRFESLLRPLPIALALLDNDLRYIWVNDLSAVLDGVPPSQHLGRTVAELIGPDTVLEDMLRAHLADDTADVARHELRSDDISPGSPDRVFELTMFRVRSNSGEPIGIGVAADEITARRRAELDRDAMLDEMRNAIRLRDEFLSIASHELKTPLTPLALRLAALQKRADRGERISSQSIADARRSLSRLTSLINDLLDASRISAGRMELHRHRTSLNERTIQVVRSLEHTDHRIALDLPDVDTAVEGDPLRLDQVLMNLLENAFKFSPSDSTVHVSVRRHDGTVLLSVRDEGIGIPPEQQPLLFERFFRARNARPTSYGGLGLGLYISRDIVERHGGRIWVESDEGQGATFHVLLPAATPAWAEDFPEQHA